MYIDRFDIDEYPFDGSFYEKPDNLDVAPSERDNDMKLVFSTKCDIQQSAKSRSAANGFINASYNIYFPFKKNEGISIKPTMIFKGYMYNFEVKGEVISVFPSQLGGCLVSIKDLE